MLKGMLSGMALIVCGCILPLLLIRSIRIKGILELEKVLIGWVVQISLVY